MDLIVEGLSEAWRLIRTGDPEVFHAVGVSLGCTSLAVALAAVVAVPYGAWLAVRRPRGASVHVFLLRVGMSVPTVVIGLAVFAFLSRSGLLGGLDLLHTRAAIVVGETLLAFPLLATLSHGAASSVDPRAAETARTLGAGRMHTLLLTLGEARVAVVGALLATFGRCITELGIAITVGGSFAMRTRTLPGATALELAKGRFGAALAPGILLLVLAAFAAAVAFLLSRESRS